MVRQRAVRPAVAVQSDAAVGSPGPRYRVDLVAAAEPAKAASPVRAAAAPGAAAAGGGGAVPPLVGVPAGGAGGGGTCAPLVGPFPRGGGAGGARGGRGGWS